jgi:branched-chain amino acid transport system permease protein
VGVLFGLPSLRIKGFYLAVATLAAQFFVVWALTKFPWFSNKFLGRDQHPKIDFFGIAIDTPVRKYLFVLAVVACWRWWPRTWCAPPPAAPGWRCATWTWPPR